jgi:hypothetical protein
VVASVVLALTAALALAGPAHAGRRTVLDPANDVVKQIGQEPQKAAPHYDASDVTRFVTTLTQTRLVLSTGVRNLPKNYWAMLWEVQTDAGTRYDIDLLKTGEVRFSVRTGGIEVPCEGMTRKADQLHSRVTVSLPLSCLGEPTTVRTGAGAAASTRSLGRIYTDDAQRVGAYSGSELALGRTVKRG